MFNLPRLDLGPRSRDVGTYLSGALVRALYSLIICFHIEADVKEDELHDEVTHRN